MGESYSVFDEYKKWWDLLADWGLDNGLYKDNRFCNPVRRHHPTTGRGEHVSHQTELLVQAGVLERKPTNRKLYRVKNEHVWRYIINGLVRGEDCS